MELFWPIITTFGDMRFWLAALLFLGVYIAAAKPRLSKHAKRALIIFLLTFVVVSVTTQAIKMTVNEPRICTHCPASNCNPYCPTDEPYGFPSGHAALAFGMFTAGWVAFSRNNKERAKLFWIFIIPAAIAYSRIALGVHTPEQVVAGAAVGIVGAAVVWYALKTWRYRG
jgi:undecaprenyl-diphosphatase